MTIPSEHIVDSHKMEGDGIVYLYEMTPKAGGTIYFKADNNVDWQGHSYTGTAVQIDQRDRNSDGTLTRPKLTLANPLGIYSALIAAGGLDDATVIERKVLYQHILSNTNIFQQRTWKVRHVPQLSRLMVLLELRDSLDGQKFLLPARQFVPPYFPSVSL